jgi:hypothetical protein
LCFDVNLKKATSGKAMLRVVSKIGHFADKTLLPDKSTQFRTLLIENEALKTLSPKF